MDHQISSMIADLDAQAQALKEKQREIESRYNPDHPLAVQAREEVAQVGKEIHELGKKLSPHSPSPSWRTTLLAGPIILILACIILVFLIIIPTIIGWRTLRKLRLSGQHRGRISAAFAALLVPLLIVDILIFLLIAGPATGSWHGPAISLAGVLIVAADIWLIWLLWRWLNSTPSPEEQAAYTRQITPTQAKSSHRWIIWLVVAIVFLPVLFIGGCAVLFLGLRVASHDENDFSPGDLQRLEAPAPQVPPVPSPPRPVALPDPDPSILKPKATQKSPFVDPYGSPSKPTPKPKATPQSKSVDPFGSPSKPTPKPKATPQPKSVDPFGSP